MNEWMNKPTKKGDIYLDKQLTQTGLHLRPRRRRVLRAREDGTVEQRDHRMSPLIPSHHPVLPTSTTKSPLTPKKDIQTDRQLTPSP